MLNKRDKNTDILTYGNEFFKESFTVEENESYTYNKKSIPLLRDQFGRVCYLDLKDAIRMIILGAAGSGKTFLLRALLDRIAKAGYNACVLNDVKDEFKSSRNPVQPKFMSGLLPNEEPTALPIITLRPSFFKQNYPTLAKDNFWFSFDIRKLKQIEFDTLLNAEKMTPKQQMMLEEIFESIFNKYHKENPTAPFSVDIIEQFIEGYPELKDTEKQALKFKFRPLYKSTFNSPNDYVDLITLMSENKMIPCVNMMNFNHYSDSGVKYPEVVLSMFMRTLIAERRKENNSRLGPLFMLFEELSRFVNKDKNNSIRYELQESFELDRRQGISYAVVVQSMSRVPEPLIENSRYILIPYSADTMTIKDCLLRVGLTKFQQNLNRDAVRLKDRMKKCGEALHGAKGSYFPWCLIDKFDGSTFVGESLCPLSAHMETY